MVRWDEPGWLDQPFAGDTRGGLIAPLPVPAPVEASSETELDPVDWIERLAHLGLPSPSDDPLAKAVQLPPVSAEPIDRFEVIWPSGEVDEQFGGQPLEVYPNPDIDRAGPTARLVRDGGARGTTIAAVSVSDVGDDEVAHAIGTGVEDIEHWLASEATRAVGASDVVNDDVLMAVRQAVADIEIGSLTQGERRVGPRSGAVLDIGLTAAPGTLEPPGRVVVREAGEVPVTSTGRMTRPSPSAGSVFDVMPPLLPVLAQAVPAIDPSADESDGQRVSALRRLIGSLRRR
jgi:hypothetical protein